MESIKSSQSSSVPPSPSLSLFSRTHCRFPSSSSASSAVEQRSLKTQLAGLREEPIEPTAHRDSYFRTSITFEPNVTNRAVDFSSLLADPAETASTLRDSYDLDWFLDDEQGAARKRVSTNSSRFQRLGTRLSSMSRRRPKRSLEGPLPWPLRSRTNSTTSTLVNTTCNSSVSRNGSVRSPHPTRTAVFDGVLAESGVPPLDSADMESANRPSIVEERPKPSTPLLPPVMVPGPVETSDHVQSPLQSPPVASPQSLLQPPSATNPMSPLPSPPVAKHMSATTDQNPHRASRQPESPVPESHPPITMPEITDEWSDLLGHANFVVHPEPYLPEQRTRTAYRDFRDAWALARCNYAKHLVRTGEHCGVTSKIYRWTEEKGRTIDRQWKDKHAFFLNVLDPESPPPTGSRPATSAGISTPHARSPSDITIQRPQTPHIALHIPLVSADADADTTVADTVRIPRLHSGKFPILGDQDIVGPMTVAPPRATAQAPGRMRAGRGRRRGWSTRGASWTGGGNAGWGWGTDRTTKANMWRPPLLMRLLRDMLCQG